MYLDWSTMPEYTNSFKPFNNGKIMDTTSGGRTAELRLRRKNFLSFLTRNYVLEVSCDCGTKSEHPLHLRGSGVDTIVTESGAVGCPGCKANVPYAFSY